MTAFKRRQNRSGQSRRLRDFMQRAGRQARWAPVRAALFCLLGPLLLLGCAAETALEETAAPENPPVVVLTLAPALPATASPTSSTVSPSIAAEIATETSRFRAAAAQEASGTPVTSHTVAPGEILSRIAERYGVSVNALLAANNLDNPNLLEVGQVLQLPHTPLEFTADFRILPDSRLVRSIEAAQFDTAAFISGRSGALRTMRVHLETWRPDGSQRTEDLSAAQTIERVSLEYSVDPRLLLAFLEHFAGLLSLSRVDAQTELYPLLSQVQAGNVDRAGLYNQLSWLADRLNRGYYDWKYRGLRILEFADGQRLNYATDLNAATVAAQYVLAQLRSEADWRQDISADGLYATYRRLFGDPFAGAHVTVPAELQQPDLTLPFPKGEVWRFTGGFHGGWGNGSAWSAIDFAPPAEAGGACYVSSYPTTAVARGAIARLGEGLVILDLDGDGNEGSGWAILYLHIDHHDALRVGQVVEAGNILGYASCLGGYATATHLHIARRYNGEWIPADCNRCRFDVATPPFVMSGWRVVGLGSQLYQGFMVRETDNYSVVAEQGRHTDINAISW